MAAVLFSIMGLVIAIIEYEIAQYNKGGRGEDHFNLDGGPNSEYAINLAIEMRMSTPETQLLRWMNAVTSVVTIFFLIWRKFDKTNWGNNLLREQLYFDKFNEKPMEYQHISGSDLASI